MTDLIATAYGALGAFGVGFMPALLWLTFWLFEDWNRPEPNRRLIGTFIAGMLCVAAVLPLQQYLSIRLELGVLLILAWAAIEEICKFIFAWVVALRMRDMDEPIDFPIYMITVALGFAAVENTLFLIDPSLRGDTLAVLETSNLRFLGATLIHVLSSATLGGMLALAFYGSRTRLFIYGCVGVILAIALHTAFNLLIIKSGGDSVLTTFLSVWVGIVFILLALERIKLLRAPRWWEIIFTPKK